MPSAPADEYRARLRLRRTTHDTLTALDARLSRGRLATVAAGTIVAVLAWNVIVSVWWVGLPILTFAVLVRRHDQVIRARDAAARAVTFYERGLRRLDDNWSGTGEPGERFRDDRHPYANDLDLFGPGSLFELLSIARTRVGEETLAAWLTAPAPPAEVRARQEAVTELTPALDLREAISMAGADLRASVDSQALVEWAEGQRVLRHDWLRPLAVVLSGAAVGSAGYWALTGNPAAFITVVIVEVLYSIPQRAHIQRALHAAEGPARDLDVLAHVLQRLEREEFRAPRLAARRHELATTSVAASTIIRRLHRLVELHDWQHNQFFAPVAAAFLWGTHLAWAIERWRRAHGADVRSWLDAVGDFEALSSLSAYRYEHPDDAWPEIIDAPRADNEDGAGNRASFAATSPQRAVFAGDALGHPLIPAARMVRNDVHLSGATQLLIVSGSNMSGKSTLLRTVGINGVLALAGAPVRAHSLRLTPLVLGATLRIQDSLQEGRSRFYAEITRIRELADIAQGPRPLLFLLDELFQGTNSHDRLVGASQVLRRLLDCGAVGLITTHDLALTAVAAQLTPRAQNVHFEDRFEGGEILFDYRVKPGPVARSNAIALMRAVGLDVD